MQTLKSLFLAGPAALLGVGGAAGLWLWRAPGSGLQVLAAAGALALAAVVGMVWETRARAARRWNAALDAYAAQEIVRASRRQRGARGRGQGGLEVPVVSFPRAGQAGHQREARPGAFQEVPPAPASPPLSRRPPRAQPLRGYGNPSDGVLPRAGK
jgi:hypothetical protein